MSVSPDELKRAVRHFASGVTIVAALDEDGPHGMTASSFASVSLDPPLVLVSMEEGSRSRSLIKSTGRFAVNILRSDQIGLAKTFATTGEKSFEAIPHTLTGGFAFLDNAIANLGCVTTTTVPGGDHEIFIAEVVVTRVVGGEPLVYHDRSYRSLSSAEP